MSDFEKYFPGCFYILVIKPFFLLNFSNILMTPPALRQAQGDKISSDKGKTAVHSV
jgi:hypothetical protein